jgi:RNA polymerase sigma-70 factor (ECF subfamily)
MRMYQQADGAAAAALVHHVSPALYRFLAVESATRADAEDLLQETWLQVHKARHTWRPDKPVLPWLYAIARHVKVDGYRRHRRLRSHELGVEQLPEAPARPDGDEERFDDFETLTAQLPPAQREVVTLLKVKGMSLEEVARVKSLTKGAVKLKAHRAYATLRRVLLRNARDYV